MMLTIFFLLQSVPTPIAPPIATTSEAFYIVIGALIAFILGFAALLIALGVIWNKLVRPIRERVDQKLFQPLEEAVKQVANISTKLNNFDARLLAIEKKFEATDVSVLADRLAESEMSSHINRYSVKYLFENDPKPLFILNEKAECIFANAALCELMDVDSTDLERRKWQQKIHYAERAEGQRCWQECYENKTPFDYEQTLLIGSGTARPKRFRVCAEPIVYNNVVVRFIGTVETLA